MWTALALSVLTAAPQVHGELSTHSGFSLGGDLGGGMQDLGGRVEVHVDELCFLVEAWARPFNVTSWSWLDAGNGQFSTRVVGAHVSGGFDGEVLPTFYWLGTGEFGDIRKLIFNGGPSVGVSFGRDDLRFEARVAWLSVSPTPDPVRFNATAELSWRVLQVRASGGVGQLGLLRSASPSLYPFFSFALGLRFRW